MDRTCAACGETFQAKTSRAKYCSDRCKRRYLRGARAEPPAGEATAKGKTEPAGEGIKSAETATMLELADAKRLGTPLGQTALILARRLDASHADTGAGVASLAKQLQATLAAATADAEIASDPVDELRDRRERKQSSAS